LRKSSSGARSLPRLHPVEWNIGEAAGALAAYYLEQHDSPRSVRNKPERLSAFQSRLAQQGIEIAWPRVTPRCDCSCSKFIISLTLIPDFWVTHSVSLPFLPSCLHHSLFRPRSLTGCFIPSPIADSFNPPLCPPFFITAFWLLFPGPACCECATNRCADCNASFAESQIDRPNPVAKLAWMRER
jgi:hypothetical protein